MTTTMMQPVLVGPGKGRTPQPLRFPGQEILVKASCQDTNGSFAAGLVKVEPMSGPPLHVHTREDEWFYILKGEFTFQVGDESFVARPGTSVFAPRDIPHAFQNFTGEVLEAIVVVSPGEFENFFVDVNAAPLSPDQMSALFERYGMTVLGPPLTA